MRGPWLKPALGVVAMTLGPLTLFTWNQIPGQRSFSSPVGGEKWFAPRPAFFEASGFKDPELSPVGNVFNWTSGVAEFRFPRLARSRPAVVTVRIQGVEIGKGAEAQVVFSVDGVETERLPVPRSPKRVSLDLPVRQARGAVVSMKVENAAGAMVENVRLSSKRGSLPIPIEAIGALAFAGLAAYFAALMAGAPPWTALAAVFMQACALSWLSGTGGAFLGRYSEKLAWLAGLGLVLSMAGFRLRDPRWRRVSIAVVWVAILKLAILSHPQILDADAAGHAGNLRRVVSGDWFFTSATPPPAISFPYPPGLYVAALPFSSLPQNQWVTLLRGIVVGTETLAAATFSVAIAALSTEAVGALTFLFLALSPEGFVLLLIGNLSNLFSDALMIFGCSFLITRQPVLASLTLLGGFLSHFGTLLLGVPLSLLLGFIQGEGLTPLLRRVAPALTALMLSFLLYYRQFMRVVIEAWDRMAHLAGASEVGPMTAPIADKLARLGGGGSGWITALVLVAMAIGIITWPKDRPALSRILFAWLLVIVGFALLGLFTPVQVRAVLSARPAVAVLCASGVCALWGRGGWARGFAFVLVALTAVAGWTIALGFFPVRPG